MASVEITLNCPCGYSGCIAEYACPPAGGTRFLAVEIDQKCPACNKTSVRHTSVPWYYAEHGGPGIRRAK